VRLSVIHFLLTIAILSNNSLVAQERLSTDEIFAWFPMGYYEQITHSDEAELAQQETYPIYKEKFDGVYRMFYFGDLPSSLQEGIESVTSATLLRLRVSKYADAEDGRKTALPGRPGRMGFAAQVGDKTVRLEGAGDRLYVYRYADLDSLIKKALDAGEIEIAGTRIADRSVYRLRAKDYAGQENEYFAYATVTQELLVAGRAANLRAMVEAGLGHEMGLLNEPDNAELIEIVPELGQRWQVSGLRHQWKLLAEKMREAGADDARMADFEERHLEKGERYFIQAWELGETILKKDISICGDEETARQYAEVKKSSYTRPLGNDRKLIDYAAQMEKSIKIVIEGNTSVLTINYDDKLLQAAKDSREARKRAYEEMRKKYLKEQEDKK